MPLPDIPELGIQPLAGGAAQVGPSSSAATMLPAAPELTLRKLLFSFSGRIGNGAYLAGVVLPIAVLFGVIFAAGTAGAWINALLGPASPAKAVAGKTNPFEAVAIALLVACAILWFWAKIALAVKRCHDMNVTAAVLLLSLIPYVGILVFLWLVFGPGTEGPNRWGRTMRWSAEPERKS